MKDDEEGFGKQSIAIFGTPGNPQAGARSSNSSSAGGTLRCAATATRPSTSLSAARSFMATRPAGFTKSRAIPITSFGRRPWLPTASSKCSMAGSERGADNIAAAGKRRRFPRPRRKDSRHRGKRSFRRSKDARANGAGEADRTLPPVRPRPGSHLPQGARRAGRVPSGVLRAGPPPARRVRRVALGGPGFCLALPRRAARPHLGPRRRRSGREAQRGNVTGTG